MDGGIQVILKILDVRRVSCSKFFPSGFSIHFKILETDDDLYYADKHVQDLNALVEIFGRETVSEALRRFLTEVVEKQNTALEALDLARGKRP